MPSAQYYTFVDAVYHNIQSPAVDMIIGYVFYCYFSNLIIFQFFPFIRCFNYILSFFQMAANSPRLYVISVKTNFCYQCLVIFFS